MGFRRSAPRSGSLILLANVLQAILQKVLSKGKVKIFRFCNTNNFSKDYFRQQYHLFEIALLILGIYLANGGGITQKVSQNLDLRDGIVQVYNENAATNHVYASITGYWASDRTPADGKYLIITPGK